MTDCNACADPELTDEEFWDEEQEEGKQEFKVNNDILCEWCIKKIKKETAEHDRLVALAKAEIEELNRKIALQDQLLESRIGYLKSKLWEYFQTVEHKETKTQETYKLLSGSLVFKKPTQKMTPDKEKLLEYVKANNMPEYIKVKEDVDWACFKKDCGIEVDRVISTKTGEIIDCIAVEAVPGEFSIKL